MEVWSNNKTSELERRPDLTPAWRNGAARRGPWEEQPSPAKRASSSGDKEESGKATDCKTSSCCRRKAGLAGPQKASETKAADSSAEHCGLRLGRFSQGRTTRSERPPQGVKQLRWPRTACGEVTARVLHRPQGLLKKGLVQGAFRIKEDISLQLWVWKF